MSDEPVPATPGSTVEVCPFTGTSKQGAALLAEISEKHAVLVGLEHEVAFGDALAIRYWDGDLAAYQVSVRVSDPNPTVERTEVLLLGDWKTVELRRGQRIPMPRLSLVAEARDDSGKVIRRYQLVAADLSGVGCGVTGVGPPPPIDGPLFLHAGDDGQRAVGARSRRARLAARVRLVERRAGVPPREPRGARVAPGLARRRGRRRPGRLRTRSRPRRGRACAPRRSDGARPRRPRA